VGHENLYCHENKRLENEHDKDHGHGYCLENAAAYEVVEESVGELEEL
jgi:hypothetical protein